MQQKAVFLIAGVLLVVPGCVEGNGEDALRPRATVAPAGATSEAPRMTGSVSAPVSVAQNKMVVEDSLLQITDSGFGQQPADLTAGEGLAEVVPGTVYLLSALTDHEADVRMELWAGEPAAPEGKWPEQATFTMPLEGPSLSLTVVSGEFGEEDLTSVSPGEHRVQVLRRLNAPPGTLPSPLFSGGYEAWLVRFWPTGG